MTLTRIRGILRRLQWTRGLRAGVAVLAAMVVCKRLELPMGWAALGGFEAILVDNGGPYRTRLTTIATLLCGGALACVAGALASTPLALAVGATAAFCFAFTFARVLSQELASTSVIILVLYFAGFGGGTHTLPGALENAGLFVLGGCWAALLSLALWPIDPFRPARIGVAKCFSLLAATTEELATAPEAEHQSGDLSDRERDSLSMEKLARRMRLQMEAARRAIGSTPARATVRTIRARSLAVLLETADMLFAGTIRLVELKEGGTHAFTREEVRQTLRELGRTESAISDALKQRPRDGGASFAAGGSHRLNLERASSGLLQREPLPDDISLHIATEKRDALQNIEVAFEATRSLWSGVEERFGGGSPRPTSERKMSTERISWMDPARANWTTKSIMMQHALRMALVGAVDVLLMRLVHVSHGSWLAMTSIIVLQPHGSGTLRKSLQRVGGTIAGGILAAVMAAAIHSQTGIIAVITLTSTLTLATYAVDYAWYCFFLTPTFVLLGLPHLRDWQVAELRMGLTVLGAVVAVLAMRLLWRRKESVDLAHLLARLAATNAVYIRAVLQYWDCHEDPRTMERTILAPARRACGLAANDAEETLDRLLLEPAFGRRSSREIWEDALSFATYSRRATRTTTALAPLGSGDVGSRHRLESILVRFDRLGLEMVRGFTALEVEDTSRNAPIETDTMTERLLHRLERQVGVLERSAAGMGNHRTPGDHAALPTSPLTTPLT